MASQQPRESVPQQHANLGDEPQDEEGPGSYISLGARQALQLQRKAKDIVRLTTSEPLITSGWQFPLRAGPEAINIMATCLVASSREDSKRIQLTATRKDTGLPLLPFTGLQTNLQTCSDLGRNAFDDTQKSMGELHAICEFTIDPNGTISNIIGLLNSPEDAKYGLRPELEELKNSASELKEKAEGIEKGFLAWRDFITILRSALIEQRDVDLKAQEQENTQERNNAQAVQDKSTQKVQEMQVKVQEAKANLEKAGADVDRAMAEYYKHLSQPPPRQYTFEEVKAQLTRPEEPLTDPGFFPSITNFLFGKSDKAQYRDTKFLKDRLDEDAKRVTDALKEMNQQYESQQRSYQENVNLTENNRVLFLDRKHRVEKDYNDYVTEMFDASQAVSTAKANLSRLKSEKLELDVVRNILEDSANQLGILVTHIQKLKEFFTDLTKLVKITNDKHLKFFLRTLDSGIERGGQARDAKVINNVLLGDIPKMNLLHSILEIQARFSAIKDISSLYIDVSKRFIRPGINKMDALAFLKPAEYEIGLAKFEGWLDEARDGISNLARAQNIEIERNVRGSVEGMTRQAIEWW